ncbi:MAG: uL15 family ribosomal protein [Nitrososphaerota archaeon]|jgi:large subunit ribosomal protein L15|nr:uL15 family ribosomal protein [Nitrososphaerota archaeon]MDG6966716.1 uL15 family ribosomal protein [Nitrososphaerota archaeon]MDG6979223.1 uL15 family ribosomal protein [Nitrososphaerota archaeon]MDG7006269.1 uL15 family ribosomal protein [Nitrososphaerota archaeon]
MPTRLRKVRKMRGSRTHGYGQIGQHRHSGKQGGHGNAGLHKHKWSWLTIHDPDHFGRDPFRPPSWRRVSKWANVGDLVSLADGSDPKGAVSIDLEAKGIEKLLGGGDVTRAFNVRVSSYTERAKKKLEEAGGKILTE